MLLRSKKLKENNNPFQTTIIILFLDIREVVAEEISGMLYLCSVEWKSFSSLQHRNDLNSISLKYISHPLLWIHCGAIVASSLLPPPPPNMNLP